MSARAARSPAPTRSRFQTPRGERMRVAPRRLPDAQRQLLIQAAAFFLLISGWLGLLGPLAPLTFIAAFGGMIVLAPAQAMNGLARAWPLLMIGVLAVLSALWSTDANISLRYGVQLAITFAAGIVLISVLAPAHVVRVAFLSAMLVLLLCIASGRTGQSQGGAVLIGLLGSKNEMGALCSQAICTGLVLALSAGEQKILRMIAMGSVLLATGVLLHTFATGAVLMTMMFVGLLIVFSIASRIPAASQFALFLTILVILAPLLLVRNELAQVWEYIVVDVLNKDMGLTGRDYLWAHADRMISERPVLGYGYRSTWLGSSSETIGLLRWAGLTSGAGFNFHDTYREMAVDFGLLGAIGIGCVMLYGLLRMILRGLTKGVSLAELFFVATGIGVVIRAKVETVLGPFGASGVLLISLVAMGYIYAGRPTAQPAPTPDPRAPTRVRRHRRTRPAVDGPSPDPGGGDGQRQTP